MLSDVSTSTANCGRSTVTSSCRRCGNSNTTTNPASASVRSPHSTAIRPFERNPKNKLHPVAAMITAANNTSQGQCNTGVKTKSLTAALYWVGSGNKSGNRMS